MKAKLAICPRPLPTKLKPAAQCTDCGAGILVPIDFSAASLQAFRHAISLSEQFGARLTLLHVVNEPVSFRSLDVPGRQRQRLALLTQRLRTIMEHTLPLGVSASAIVCEGSPPVEIVRYAKRHRASTIVIGSQPHRWWVRPFRSRTLAQVIEHSFCPVVVVNTTTMTHLREKAATKPSVKTPTLGSAGQRTACPA